MGRKRKPAKKSGKRGAAPASTEDPEDSVFSQAQSSTSSQQPPMDTGGEESTQGDREADEGLLDIVDEITSPSPMPAQSFAPPQPIAEDAPSTQEPIPRVQEEEESVGQPQPPSEEPAPAQEDSPMEEDNRSAPEAGPTEALPVDEAPAPAPAFSFLTALAVANEPAAPPAVQNENGNNGAMMEVDTGVLSPRPEQELVGEAPNETVSAEPDVVSTNEDAMDDTNACPLAREEERREEFHSGEEPSVPLDEPVAAIEVEVQPSGQGLAMASSYEIEQTTSTSSSSLLAEESDTVVETELVTTMVSATTSASAQPDDDAPSQPVAEISIFATSASYSMESAPDQQPVSTTSVTALCNDAATAPTTDPAVAAQVELTPEQMAAYVTAWQQWGYYGYGTPAATTVPGSGEVGLVGFSESMHQQQEQQAAAVNQTLPSAEAPPSFSPPHPHRRREDEAEVLENSPPPKQSQRQDDHRRLDDESERQDFVESPDIVLRDNVEQVDDNDVDNDDEIWGFQPSASGGPQHHIASPPLEESGGGGFVPYPHMYQQRYPERSPLNESQDADQDNEEVDVDDDEYVIEEEEENLGRRASGDAYVSHHRGWQSQPQYSQTSIVSSSSSGSPFAGTEGRNKRKRIEAEELSPSVSPPRGSRKQPRHWFDAPFTAAPAPPPRPETTDDGAQTDLQLFTPRAIVLNAIDHIAKQTFTPVVRKDGATAVERVAELEQLLLESRRNASAAFSQYQRAQAGTQAELSLARASVQRLTAECTRLRTECVTAKDKLGAIQKDLHIVREKDDLALNEKTEKVLELQERLHDLEFSTSDQQRRHLDEVRSLKLRVLEIEAQRDSFARQLEMARRSILSLTENATNPDLRPEEVERLQNELKLYRLQVERASDVENTLAQLRKELKNLTTMDSERRAAVDELEKSNHLHEQKCQEWERERGFMQRQINRLQEANDLLERKQQEFGEMRKRLLELEHTEATSQADKQAYEQLEARLTAVEAERDRLTSELAAATNAAQEAKDAKEEHRTETSAATAALQRSNAALSQQLITLQDGKLANVTKERDELKEELQKLQRELEKSKNSATTATAAKSADEAEFKVLHPVIPFAAQQKIDSLTEELNSLRTRLQASAANQSGPASSSSSSSTESASEVAALKKKIAELENAQQQFKLSFKTQLQTMRNDAARLTGWKFFRSPDDGSYKLKSIYSTGPSAADQVLQFSVGAKSGGSPSPPAAAAGPPLDLVETAFAATVGDVKQKMLVDQKSIPGFLAEVQLKLLKQRQ